MNCRTRLAAAIEDSLCGDDDVGGAGRSDWQSVAEGLAGFAQTVVGADIVAERGIAGGQSVQFSAARRTTHSESGRPIDVPAMGFAWVGPDAQSPPAVQRTRLVRQTKDARAAASGRGRSCCATSSSKCGSIRTRARSGRFPTTQPRSPPGPANCLAAAGGERARQRCELFDHVGRRTDGDFGRAVAGRDRQPRPARGPRRPPRGRIPANDPRAARQPRHRVSDRLGHRPPARPESVGFVLRGPIRLERRGGQPLPQREHGQPADRTDAHRIAPFRRHPPRQAADDACSAAGCHTIAGLGQRKLDTLLVVHGETARSFTAGRRHRRAASDGGRAGMLAPPLVLPDQPPPTTPSGWLFHLDCRNVLATRWEPLPAETAEPTDFSAQDGGKSPPPTAADPEPCTSGFRVRLLETDGHGVQLGLRCFRDVAWRERSTPATCRRWNLVVEGDRINIPFGPHQWTEIEVGFKPR